MAVRVTFKRGSKTTQKVGKDAISEMKATMNSSVAFAYKQGLAKSFRKIREKQITIAAIFFQRLCARTPIDNYYVSSRGKHHVPDKDYTRFHWFLILNDGRKLYSGDMGEELFTNYNDSNSIKTIYNYISNALGPGVLLNSFKVGNDTDPEKFRLLEYGGYPMGDEIKIDSDGISHGVVNSHSVQAPVGMLRITKSELDRISKVPAVRDDAYRYARQVSHQIPTQRELNKMIQFMKRGKMTSSDAKDFLRGGY